MENKQTAVEWLYERLERMIPRTKLYDIDKKQYLEQTKIIEKEQEHETKQYWFGRGVLAEKENRIEELKPIKDNGKNRVKRIPK